MIEEKAAGQSLGSLWAEWPMEHRTVVIDEIVKMERKLTDTLFDCAGCVYFSDDAKIDGSIIETKPPLPSSAQGRFKIGPLVSERLWRGDRASMNLKRGPCKLCDLQDKKILFLTSQSARLSITPQQWQQMK